MSWYNPLQNTIYCGKLEITTYHNYQGDSSYQAIVARLPKYLREETWCG